MLSQHQLSVVLPLPFQSATVPNTTHFRPSYLSSSIHLNPSSCSQFFSGPFYLIRLHTNSSAYVNIQDMSLHRHLLTPPRKTTMLSHLFSRLDLSDPLCLSDTLLEVLLDDLIVCEMRCGSVSSFSHFYSFVPGHQLFLHQLTPDNLMLLSRGVDWHWLFSWIHLFFFIFGLRKGQWLQDYT